MGPWPAPGLRRAHWPGLDFTRRRRLANAGPQATAEDPKTLAKPYTRTRYYTK